MSSHQFIIRMTDKTYFRPLATLAKAENSISALSIETSYGLILSAKADGSVTVRLASDSTPEPSKTTPLDPSPGAPPADPAAAEPTEPTKPASETSSYQYYIEPDYCTNFLWYDLDWAGNPEGEFNVDDDDLEARHPAPWLAAHGAWVDAYTRGFEAAGLHLGSSDNEIFADAADRMAWVLEGALLACRLALEPTVDAVRYLPMEGVGAKMTYVFAKRDLDAALGRCLADIRAAM